jgi:hypothetical protein
MGIFKWMLIIATMVAGVFTPWQHQVVVLVALLMGYAACYAINFSGFQLALAYLYGGLATGLGLQLLIAFGIKNRVVEMLIAPLLIWLALRIVFYALETKYTLHPNEALAQIRADDLATETAQASTSQRGHSAWSGNISGQASVPDGDGRYRRYEFYCTGEIAMGGPTYGDAVFNNHCAFCGVGPSIVMSDDGRYAAMTLPSRYQWRLLLADLEEKLVYEPGGGNEFWEIDAIEKGVIIGRYSPLTSNATQKLAISRVIANSKAEPLINDDGWWVMDYPERKPFPTYSAVTVKSKQGLHKVTFVPDLKPFKANPFERIHHPSYTILIDDNLLDMEVSYPTALWVNGPVDCSVREGRFLVLHGRIIDFKDKEQDLFSVQNCTELPFIKGCDVNTNLDFEYGTKEGADDNYLLAQGYVLPQSTWWNEAEYASYSCTSPWDDEEVTIWDAAERKTLQMRSRIKRLVDYTINLSRFSEIRDLKKCVSIELVNRGNPKNTASLEYQEGGSVEGMYSAYQLSTSCGITLKQVLHECIWSHCGRFLAVVYFEHPPQVPNRIAIIDFKTISVKELPGHFALPSFIWFDADLLDFTHLVGIEESVTYGPGKSQSKTLRISEPEHAANPYDLLIGSLDVRRSNLEKQAESKRTGKGYSGATVQKIAQHCILFAPNFDKPVLQPPPGIRP